MGLQIIEMVSNAFLFLPQKNQNESNPPISLLCKAVVATPSPDTGVALPRAVAGWIRCETTSDLKSRNRSG